MAAFRVDLNHLDQVTTRLAGLVDHIEHELANLDRRAANVEDWTGETASAFDSAHREWVAGAKDLNDGISAMKRAAVRAHQTYSAATAANLANLGRG